MNVVIVGGGVIGLATAWRALARGMSVTVIDPAPRTKASYVSAGMLTPVGELTYGEEPLLRLGLASRDRYPSFVAELEEASGTTTAYRTDGILEVAFNADDLAHLDEIRRFQESLGIPAETLGGRECRKLEPLLAPSVRGGLLAPEDGSIDPRRMTNALLTAVERGGGKLIRQRAAGVLVENDVCTGVRLADGTEIRGDRTVLAAGPWTNELIPGVIPTIRPVKGQILRLRGAPGFMRQAIIGKVKGWGVYLVPRADGEIVIGATQEELGYDTTVTAGGVWELLRDARDLVPGITELEFAEVSAGLRPGSPDNAPVFGPVGPPGLLVSSGHFRNGVLLTPISAEIMAETLTTGALPEVGKPFAAERFS